MENSLNQLVKSLLRIIALSITVTTALLANAQDANDADARSKAVAERSAAKLSAIEALSKEMKTKLTSFEVSGLNLGGDYYHDVRENQGFAYGKGTDLDGFPETRSEISVEGGTLYFYKNILFMIVDEDLQDMVEIAAAMKKLETKFKGKFAKIPQEKSREGNREISTGGFRMNISGIGVAEIKIISSKPISRGVCISEITREMRQLIGLGQSNYTSLTDRVDIECKEISSPIQIVFTHKGVEAVVNARAKEERMRAKRQMGEEKLRAATERAKKF